MKVSDSLNPLPNPYNQLPTDSIIVANPIPNPNPVVNPLPNSQVVVNRLPQPPLDAVLKPPVRLPVIKYPVVNPVPHPINESAANVGGLVPGGAIVTAAVLGSE